MEVAALAATPATARPAAAHAAPDARRIRRLLAAEPDMALLDAAAPCRDAAEHFVADCFRRAYGAEVTQFAPLLFTLTSGGALRGVAGLREAATGPLFIEHYLDAPVEHGLAGRYADAPRRDEIIEFGNLAAPRTGACELMFTLLAQALQQAGYRFVVFAGTEQVDRIVAKLGFDLRCLGRADPDRLGPEAANWGSYYAAHPAVFAVSLDVSMRWLAQQALMRAIVARHRPALAELVAVLRRHGQRACMVSA